jgi:hypothetical protein
MIVDDRRSIAISTRATHLSAKGDRPVKEKVTMKKSLRKVLVTVLTSAFSFPLLAQTFSDWAPPVNLGATVNTTSGEQFVFVTRNGLSLYFVSDRPGGFGALDIYVSRRATINDPWGLPQNLGPKINTDAMEHCPFVTPDGSKLIFASDRPGSVGLNDLHVAFRQNTQDDLAWDNVRNLTELNSAGDEYGLSGFQDPDSGILTVFFNSSRQGGLGGFDIYTSQVGADGKFSTPKPVPELSSKDSDRFSMVRFDGLELLVTSNRAGTLGGEDLWVATRGSIADSWSTPVNIGTTINAASNEVRGFLYAGGTRLIFHSNRTGGSGSNDLYETTRTRTALVPVVGSVTGFGGTTFKTFAQISNPSSATINGTLVFHPAGQSSATSDPRVSYTLEPFETRTFTDLMSSFGVTGVGSLEVVPTTGPAPSSSVRIEDGGAVTIPQVRGDDVLTSRSRAVLTTPADLTRSRLNIGVRALSSGVTMTVTLYEAAGAMVRSVTRTFAPSSLSQMSAADFVGGSVGPNQSIVISVDAGSAVAYGSTVSNTGQGSTFQIAARVVQ